MAYEFTRKTDAVDDVMAIDINELQDAIETISAGGSGISAVVDDTTPQLGGDLDLNGHIIIGEMTNDGWTPVSGSWAYNSATTITVPAGAALIYSVGDKIKFTQTTVKFFTITKVENTKLTVSGAIAIPVANAAISATYYSHTSSPVGFPYPGLAYYPIDKVALLTAAAKTENTSGTIDVSSYVPAGAKYVWVSLFFTSTNANARFSIGDAEVVQYCQVATIYISNTGIVKLNSGTTISWSMQNYAGTVYLELLGYFM